MRPALTFARMVARLNRVRRRPAGAGPSFKGVAGSQVTLTNGQTVTADDAYLEQSITKTDAQIVKGYNPGIMPAAIASSNLAGKPNDIRSFVAFIKAQK